MSINREIWRKASRLSEPRVAGAFAAGLVVGVMPWGRLRDDFNERQAQRRSMAPLVAEASRSPVTFPQVVVAHPAHLHKLVYWDVTVQSSSSSFVEGRPAWPVVWTNFERIPADQRWAPVKVVARVEAVKDDVVWLEYLGRP
jgi:hypothetical protein